VRICFATWSKAEYQGRILSEEGGVDRLISYWEAKDQGADTIENYVRDGKIGKKLKKAKVMVNGWDETERMPLTAARLAEMRPRK
jgi:hypothetical protein